MELESGLERVLERVRVLEWVRVLGPERVLEQGLGPHKRQLDY